ncbi:MAG TPA: hypothetical protein VIV57_11015 [Anaeromyxobacter sp.]
MRSVRILSFALAAALAGRAAAEGPSLVTSLGPAWLEQGRPRRTTASGLALELRIEGRPDPWIGYGLTFTWGLTDWDRAREYIDAGNRAGSWTTDRFADVEAWVRKASEKDRGARLLAALFADFFLALTYAAVPACYAGSAFGATSHVQLDFTGSFHLAEGRADAWLEVGGGAASLPERLLDWRRAVGPVAGVGARFGWLRVSARMLWSPPALNTASRGGTVLLSALTFSLLR